MPLVEASVCADDLDHLSPIYVRVSLLHGSCPQAIEARISAYAMVPVENGELLQVLR